MISSVLIGRGSERASIDAAYQRARRGGAVTVLVSGEAGIGKSRLVTTATADLPGEPLLLAGGCLEVGANAAPYVPFVAILRDLVRQLGRAGVDALLPLDGSALAAWLPGLTPAPAGRTRLLEELLTLVSRAAARRPVVLVVEDLHWADASSREVFVYLARNLTDRPVLLLATVPGELASGHPGRQVLAELGRRGDVVRVDLPPLGRPHVAELLAAIGGRTPDPVRSSLIHRRSGGNPLFVEALHATEDFEGNLRTLLLDRVAALPAQAQSLLPVIAVAGTTVSEEQLLTVGELPEVDLHSALRTLVDHEQLVVRDDGYAIRHDLIREAVYKALLPHDDRRRLHRRYARTVADPAALAEHWTAAGEPALALPAALLAADLARQQYAYDEELNLLERALDLWPRVPGAEQLTRTDQVSVHERATAASFSAGNSAAGMAHGTAAIAGLDPTAEPVRVARLLELRGRLRNRIDSGGRADVEAAVALVPRGVADDVRGELLAALAFVAAIDAISAPAGAPRPRHCGWGAVGDPPCWHLDTPKTRMATSSARPSFTCKAAKRPKPRVTTTRTSPACNGRRPRWVWPATSRRWPSWRGPVSGPRSGSARVAHEEACWPHAGPGPWHSLVGGTRPSRWRKRRSPMIRHLCTPPH
ncbi:ATP-binding protein [Fodinicola feengrottensis]|uniref:ATP-binding protein n=1 Tax=Fodinicola feengrottensis TaxID=435914 RepID=UPI0013D1747F|nr:AAA family ATPase [Fodinicola feengrottensis]